MLIIILIIAFGVGYSEMIWSLVVKGQRTYMEADRGMKFVAYFTYVLAILFGAWGCLIYGAILSLYQIVIFKKRQSILDGPVA